MGQCPGNAVAHCSRKDEVGSALAPEVHSSGQCGTSGVRTMKMSRVVLGKERRGETHPGAGEMAPWLHCFTTQVQRPEFDLKNPH